MTSKPESNEIAVGYATNAYDLYVMFWNGTDFETAGSSSSRELETSLSYYTTKSFDLKYEEGGDHDLVVAYGTSTVEEIQYRYRKVASTYSLRGREGCREDCSLRYIRTNRRVD